MVGQEIQMNRLLMVSKTVQFDAIGIVYIQVLFLCYCVHLFILQEFDVSDKFFGLKLADQVLVSPVDHGQVSLVASE